MVRNSLAVGLVLLCVLASACASGGGRTDTAMTLTPVGEWRLVAIEGEAFELPQGARLPTLTVREDGSVGGLAGINRFSGSVDADAWDDNGWIMGPAAMTRMAGTPAAMDFESRYIELLGSADLVYPWPKTMDLLQDGRFLLRFERVGE
ncbi:MAG: META domain-containing protein [Planctomycetota bacterium]